MDRAFLISIDQGTTGSRVFCYDTDGRVISSSYREFTQHFPKPGWVEHDAEEIWSGVVDLLGEAIQRGGLQAKDALGIGITNQRETVVLWDRATGHPVHRAIVWQCRRTADICEALKREGHEPAIRRITGLRIDPYFSGTKIRWILDAHPELAGRAARGELAAGTIDSFLLYKLTGEFATDFTNASRTMLFNIRTREWDPEMIALLGVPMSLLPPAFPSRHRYGVTKSIRSLPDGVPVLAMVGDQQGALFGQLCVEPDEIKNTYGTGCFLLKNTGSRFVQSDSGLLTTLACDAKGMPVFALEGSVFIGGAALQWLRDSLRFFADASETEEIIGELSEEPDDLVFVPAFAGLGAPYWDMKARGGLFGLTRDTTPAHIVRAAVKSIALQTYDVVLAMERDTGTGITELRVDGGAAKNGYLLSFQAGILNHDVIRPEDVDTTALGAAYLAGIEAGVWGDAMELKKIKRDGARFSPSMDERTREFEIRKWKKGIERVRNWKE
jgi:glycerol kinase